MPAWSRATGHPPAAGRDVGRHAAADGASSDPLVAAALAAREVATGVHRRGPRAATDDGDLGWPGAPDRKGGGGLGWPGGDQDAAETEAGEAAVPARPRRGWRRLFGSAPAA
jgi:hypothetical protein